MKKRTVKLFSLSLAVIMLLSLFAVIPANAAENGKVRVIVKNDTYSAGEGAVWDGELFDDEFALEDTDSMQTVVERALTENGYSFKAPGGFLSEINGLSLDKNDKGGWMISLNDWFTSDGASSYTVANGTLSANDEICVQFTRDWGADCGSLYGDFDTSLTSVEISGGLLTADFVPSAHDYTVEILDDTADIELVPNAYNKNYQVRAYLNAYAPENKADFKRSETVAVTDGDKIYVGIGNPSWPSMNSWAGTAKETVYTFTVKKVLRGDVNDDGRVNINDATQIQRYLAEFIDFTLAVQARADFDKDLRLCIDDATAIQRALANLQ